MGMIKFTDPEVDKRFEALVEKDRMVELPGTYSGRFSNITRAMATKMVRQGCDNLIKAKDGVKEEEAALSVTDKLADKSVIPGE